LGAEAISSFAASRWERRWHGSTRDDVFSCALTLALIYCKFDYATERPLFSVENARNQGLQSWLPTCIIPFHAHSYRRPWICNLGCGRVVSLGMSETRIHWQRPYCTWHISRPSLVLSYHFLGHRFRVPFRIGSY